MVYSFCTYIIFAPGSGFFFKDIGGKNISGLQRDKTVNSCVSVAFENIPDLQ